jgi:hypothetical protein
MAMIIILNEDFQRLRLGSQFGHAHTNQDRAEGHAKIMRGYFNPNVTYLEKYFRWRFQM